MIIDVEVLNDDMCSKCEDINVYSDVTKLFSGDNCLSFYVSHKCSNLEDCKRKKELFERFANKTAP